MKTVFAALGIPYQQATESAQEPLLGGPAAAAESAIRELLDDDVVSSRAYARYLAACATLVRRLGLAPGNEAVVVNGRVVGPLIGPGALVQEDFVELTAIESRRRVEPVVEALKEVVPTFGSLSRYVRISATC
jgi:UDP-glucose:glycoprotein glucosyltransferase